LGADEKSFAYSREVNGFKKIFVKALQGEPQQLTAGTGDDIQPKWTPDGQSIVFVRSSQARGKLEPGDVFGLYEGGDIWKKDLSAFRPKEADKALSTKLNLFSRRRRRSFFPDVSTFIQAEYIPGSSLRSLTGANEHDALARRASTSAGCRLRSPSQLFAVLPEVL